MNINKNKNEPTTQTIKEAYMKSQLFLNEWFFTKFFGFVKQC